MIAHDCPTTGKGMAQLHQLVSQTQVQLHRAHAMCNRVTSNLAADFGGSEESAEGGWRRWQIC